MAARQRLPPTFTAAYATRPSSVETSARNPSHLGSKDPEPEGSEPRAMEHRVWRPQKADGTPRIKQRDLDAGRGNYKRSIVADPDAARSPYYFGRHKTLHIVLAIFTVGLWLLVLLAFYLWRKNRRGYAMAVASVTALLVILVALGSATSPETNETAGRDGRPTVGNDEMTVESQETETESTETAPASLDEERGERCSRFGDNVENYDILAAGASRAEYLTLLHRFQRDCGDEALARRLDSSFLPQCERLDQENCTMYPR